MPGNKSDLWGNTDAYENYMGRWSKKVAPLFLQWLDAPGNKSWIDIGCGTGGLTELNAFESADLADVSVNALDIPTAFKNFGDYWNPFLGGVGSAPKYCASLDESIQDKIKNSLQEKLPTGPDGEILLAARAWAIKGMVAK